MAMDALVDFDFLRADNVADPFAVRLAMGEAILDRLVGEDFVSLGVDGDHSPWTEPAFLLNPLRRQMDQTGFRTDDDESVGEASHFLTFGG